MKTWQRSLALGLLLSLVACGTGNSEYPASLNTPAMIPVWSLKTPVFGHFELFGNLIVGGDTNSQQTNAVDAVNHKVAWMNLRKTAILGGNNFTHDDHYLYVATIQYNASEKSLLVLATDGTVVNSVNVPERASIQTTLGPRVIGNRLYLTAGTELLAFDTATIASGSPRPVLDMTFPGLPIIVEVAFDSAGNPYVSTRDSHIYALEQSGKIRWSVDIKRDAPINLTSADGIAISGNTLVATGGGGFLEAFDTATGKPRWNGQDGRWPIFNNCTFGQAGFATYIEFGDGKIFISPDGGTCVSAFDLATGQLSWVFDSPNTLTFASQPLFLNGVLYATNTRLWAIDAQTGKALGVGKAISNTSLSANVQYSSALNELYVWGDELAAYRPVR